MISFDIQTMGCKVNTYDTSLLQLKLGQAGFLHDDKSAKVKIINSCAVTERSSLDTHKLIKKIKAHEPDTVVVVTGCVAQVDVERLRSLSGADLIIGNSHKSQMAKIIEDFLLQKNSERVFHSNIFKKDDLEEGGGIESSHTRAFLKIQDGCNSFCSFCIIPFARGKSRSIPAENLIKRVRNLHLKGFQEVVLTGVHCGDYESDGLEFAGLVKKILSETRIPRVRLSSLEPIEVTEDLWKLFKEESRLCPHIHMSLQAANTKVLSDMKRKYTQGDVLRFFDRFQATIPHGYIGMDVIAGFPGETDEEFEDTFQILAQAPWTRIHVFPYSIRKGTLAARRSDHLPDKIIRARAKKLRDLSALRMERSAFQQIGSVKKVLILEKPGKNTQGLARDYWSIHFEQEFVNNSVNREIDVVISDVLKLSNGDFSLKARGLNESAVI